MRGAALRGGALRYALKIQSSCKRENAINDRITKSKQLNIFGI